MKKHGYTLAETLITLGIIGIAATLISPTFRQLIPSKEKMEFMECYRLLTNAFPAIDYTPQTGQYQYVYDDIKETGKIYPTCLGVACVNLASEIAKASSSSVYTWSESSVSEKLVNNNRTRYYDSVTVTCKSEKSGNSYSFNLDGRGTIKGLDEKGSKFMKDQFNYYKKGNEDEEQ